MIRKFVVPLLVVILAGEAAAELQQVEVGGEIRIRGRHWDSNYSRSFIGVGTPRYSNYNFAARPFGPFGLLSRFDFDNDGDDFTFVEHNTRLFVRADFTDDVTSFVEFESFNIWGSDFRSNYISGQDLPGGSDVQLYQAYIETRNTAGHPLRVRAGRQEMKLGKGWLVGDNITPALGFTFDGIRLTYEVDAWSLDGWWHKLQERAPNDSDVDFYGLYGTYHGLESLKVSAYWFLVRDGAAPEDTNGGPGAEWIEELWGLDDYDSTWLHTLGTRLWGSYGAFDYDWELSYQFGEADAVGAQFNPLVYGDDGARFDAIGSDLTLGYTLDMAWSPRVYVGAAYLAGDDNRDFRFGDRLLHGIRDTQSSIAFNRLFSNYGYGLLLDINSELSNFRQVRAGFTVKPTEKLSGGLRVAYWEFNETFSTPVIPFIPFWTREHDDTMGWTTFLVAKYQYSDDLSIGIIWEHLFTGQGLEEGNFFSRNALEFTGGTDDEDADYLHFDIHIAF